MGPKDKSKNKKQEKPDGEAEDAAEHVTEIMKQFFEIQMSDIDEKIKRLQTQQQEFKEMTEKIEQCITEHQKEKGSVIEEIKGKLAQKEEEKLKKRDQLIWLGNEVKILKERLENEVQERHKKFDEMVVEMTKKLEDVEEDLRILEDFKTNKAEYLRGVEKEEEDRLERERQHQRNLFAIRQKLEMAKVRLKKEMESRLLQISIEFQETSRIKIGAPIHRMLQENRAIENELKSIKSSIRDYRIGYETSKGGMQNVREREKLTEKEKGKCLARCLIQSNVIKALIAKNKELADKVKEHLPLQEENDALSRTLKELEAEVEKAKSEVDEMRKQLAEKKDEANSMNDVSAFLKKNTRKLIILLRNSMRAAEEAMAIQLIPLGETEEEKYISEETKLKLYQKRRDLAFKKKGKFLSNLQEILLRAQLSEDERKMLSSESVTFEHADFVGLFSQLQSPYRDVIQAEADIHMEIGSGSSPELSGSDKSLPRSLTPDEVEVKPVASAAKTEEEEEEETEGETSAAESEAPSAAEEGEDEEEEEMDIPLPGEDSGGEPEEET